jgi:hypothetical protein
MTVGDARTVRGALVRGVLRGVLRGAVLLLLGSVALFVTRGEPLGNRIFLWSVAGLIFAVAGWGAIETWRELKRLRRHL